MATYTLSTLPTKLKKDDIINVSCTKSVQSIALNKGTYKFECWGARGGSLSGTTVGGYGGYVAGTITLTANTTYYLFVGGVGTNSSYTYRDGLSGVGGAGGYNGGGAGGGSAGAGGGGCTAIGTASTMASSTSIMVAGGGGGAYSSTYTTKANARSSATSYVTTTYAGASGTYGKTGCYYYDTYGGGGGYTGGTSVSSDDANYAYGGTNYVNTSLLTSTTNTAGGSVSSYPDASNGYIRITVIKCGLPMYIMADATTYKQVQSAFLKGSDGTWTELEDTDLATYFKVSGYYLTDNGNRNITPVEYIQSSGTQYIDTGFAPNNSTRVFIEVELSELPSGNSWFFGSRQSSSAGRYTSYLSDGEFGMGFDTTTNLLETAVVNTRYTVDVNGNTCSINGEVFTVATATFQNTYSLYLFAENRVGVAEQNGSFKLYSCQIYDNGTLIRDFIPALDSFGVACLYDKLNNKCYYDAAGGGFQYKHIGTSLFYYGSTASVFEFYEGMTWYDWYHSDEFEAEAFIFLSEVTYDGMVTINSIGTMATSGGANVYGSDLIIANEIYTTSASYD